MNDPKKGLALTSPRRLRGAVPNSLHFALGPSSQSPSFPFSSINTPASLSHDFFSHPIEPIWSLVWNALVPAAHA